MSASQRVRNEKLRDIRLSLKMSQSEFAVAVRKAGDALDEPNACTKRLVQRWESGARAVCQEDYRRALESVTRTPYSELGFTDSANVSPSPQSFSDFLGSVGADIADAFSVSEPGNYLRFALTRPEVANAEKVLLTTESTVYMFGLECHRPARIVLPMVERLIRETASLLAGTRHKPFRRRLAAAGGQSAALAGWLAFDVGDTAGAHRYWDSAMAAARYAADSPLLACVLTYMSYSAAERGDPTTAWQLAHAAVSHAEPNARAQAWMAVRAAQEAAQLGDSGAALAELEVSLDLAAELAPAAPEDDAPPWCRFVDRAYLWAMASNVYTRLGAADDAYATAVRALDSLSRNQVKTRAIILAEAAHAFTNIGGTERATKCVIEAAALADEMEVSLAHRRLRALPSLSTER